MRTLALTLTVLISCSVGARTSAIRCVPDKEVATTKNGSGPEWITILVHGTVAFQANLSYKTILLAKNDCIEGSDYERNVLSVREHEYLFALQPMQKMGLHPIKEENTLRGAYVFKLLYEQVQQACGIHEKGLFYTFGWTGLNSFKRRMAEAVDLRNGLIDLKRTYPQAKIRLLGYSHGAGLILNLATIKEDMFPHDTFTIDELFLIGFPVTSLAHEQIRSPIFKKIYTIYSRGDKVQRFDIFSPCDFFSHREFKGKCLPEGLTQIEMKLTACLKRKQATVLPQRMRDMHNQSPGHIELWFFGWAPSSYRQNLSMYPMPGAVFIPYLVCAANRSGSKRIVVDIRPEQEILCVHSRYGGCTATLPFMSKSEYAALISRAMEFHPSNPKYKAKFQAMRKGVNASEYE